MTRLTCAINSSFAIDRCSSGETLTSKPIVNQQRKHNRPHLYPTIETLFPGSVPISSLHRNWHWPMWLVVHFSPSTLPNRRTSRSIALCGDCPSVASCASSRETTDSNRSVSHHHRRWCSSRLNEACLSVSTATRFCPSLMSFEMCVC